ncbi:hypothetical protein MBLNU457_4296t1 [Dothideomycetes sp. NU457]
MLSTIAVAAIGGITAAAAQTYTLTDTYQGANFWSKMNFFTGADPTHGFVDYLDYSDAVSQGLIPNPSIPTWGVDNTTVISTSSAGRASVRMSSVATYNHGLFIADIAHMPSSTCGLWPAYWLLGPNWPTGGEIDIIEGVNTATSNTLSGHTSAGCTITNTGSGLTSTSTCDSSGSNNVGCGILDTPDVSSYGTGFNTIGGGVYAVEWTSAGFNIWFFHRGTIPAAVTATNPDTSQFGTPVATFTGGSGCDIDSHFHDMQIIFDTTFCGDWAGAVFNSAPYNCPGSCTSYVAENPSAFNDAYWSINSIKVYQQGVANTATVTGTSTSASTATPTTVATTNASVGPGRVTSTASSLVTYTTSSASSSVASSASSSTSSSPSATATAALCPQNNGDTYIDPATGASFVLECGIDHVGGDLKMVYVSDLAGCIAQCASTSGCVDVSLSGAACYMKNKLRRAQNNAGILGARKTS